MGCAGSTMDIKHPQQAQYQAKFKFEVRPYKGEETEETKGMMVEINASMEGMPEGSDIINMENYQMHRSELEGYIESTQVELTESQKATADKINKKDATVKMRDGVEISVLVYQPKSGEGKKLPCYFYAHGGGVFAMHAKHLESIMMRTAVDLNCVVFNVDYRRAPEHKFPGPQADFYDAIVWGLANGAQYGADPNRACIAGCSGGGWVCLGAANMMVKTRKASQLKAMFIHTGMVSNETQKIPKDKWEPYDKDYMNTPDGTTSLFKLMSTDWDKQQEDDQLFPGRASDKIMRNYPPTVVWTSEFDFLRRDNEVLADRLKGLGRLAEVSNMPGVIHDYHNSNDPETCAEAKYFFEEEKMAFEALVTNWDK